MPLLATCLINSQLFCLDFHATFFQPKTEKNEIQFSFLGEIPRSAKKKKLPLFHVLHCDFHHF